MTYGFGGRLAAGFPSQIWVDLTEVCNLACIHCPHPAFKASSDYTGQHLDPDLNARLVDEVRTHGRGRTQYIRYAASGEPLVHPKAYDLIEEAVRHSATFVTLTTNGTIMNEKRTTRLLDAGVHMIDISIDAFHPETYARVRRNGNLVTTRGNVLRLLQWVRECRGSTKVVVSFVEQPENAHEVEDFKQFWSDAGVDSVVIRRRHSSSGTMLAIANLRRGQIEAVPRRPCVYPWERVGLDASGHLLFCPSDWVHGSRVADYRLATIRDIWSGPFYSRLRAAHLDANFTNHAFCGQCPDWENTRWPDQGRSYADMVGELAGAVIA